MAQLQTTSFNQTGSVTLPISTTGNRPGSPTAGMIRVNTASNLLEFYDATGWKPVTGISKGSIGTGGDTIMYSTANNANRASGVVHMFTSTGNFTFTPAFTGTVEVLVIAGGGSGGSHLGGGGGGGGVIYNRAYSVSSGTGIPITVGAGAPRPSFPNRGNTGSNSVFGSITSYGGGAGGSWDGQAGQPGGSGGGGCTTDHGSGNPYGYGPADSRQRCFGGLGVQGQGFPGGSGVRFNNQGDNTHTNGGGGGAGGAGMNAADDAHEGGLGHGGPGAASDILGYTLYWGGGGGGAIHQANGTTAAAGGIGGGGGAGIQHGNPRQPGANFFNGPGGGMALNAGGACTAQNNAGDGGANTGGGGGGTQYQYGNHGSAGGAGIVIVRY